MDASPLTRYENQPWRKLYSRARWKNLAAAKLRAEPCCERCKAAGKLERATVVHHRNAHKGDPALFFCSLDDLESLCKPCHDIDAQREEGEGFSRAVDPATGIPLDPNHPFNKC